MRSGATRSTWLTIPDGTLRGIEGQLPPLVLGLIAEWAALHRFELRRNWTLLATGGKVGWIAPFV